MIAIHDDVLINQIKKYKDRIDDHIVVVKKEITDWLDDSPYLSFSNRTIPLTENQLNYLRLLERELDKIAKANTAKLNWYKKSFDELISENERKDESKYFLPFKDKLLEIMGYKTLRSYYSNGINPLYVDFYSDFSVKACVFCNSQLTIVALENDGVLRAKFQLDHFIDKASYPCFSISFFNLYPVCASCNNKKGNKTLDFQLYTKELHYMQNSNFKFTLDKKSLAKFRTNADENKLIIDFNDNGSGLDNLFAIKGIYNTQKDLAAEIIVKANIYNNSYKKTLQKSFNKLYGKSENNNINFNRIILGNYSEPNEIHKRPMAKLTQDIALQLGLIGKKRSGN